MRRRRSSESFERRRRRRRHSEDSSRRRKRNKVEVEEKPEVKEVVQVKNWQEELEEVSGSDSGDGSEDAAKIEEERRRRMEALANKYKAADKKDTVPAPKPKEVSEQPAPEPPVEEGEPCTAFDMFAEDEAQPNLDHDDIRPSDMGSENLLLTDNWTDKDGYYAFRAGEVLNKRYVIEGKLGAGVFSVVLKAKDTETKDTVALKVVRANETMTKTALKELEILKKLAEGDQERKMHCVTLLDSFNHRNHICLALEPMDCNLRDVLTKYGKKAGVMVGLSMSAVKSFTLQLAVALSHLCQCGVLHADFKPDNILVGTNHQTLKLSDFGSAMLTSEVEITPYLVSRFYRPPEVILGLPYSHPMDMWALGVTAYELYTGKMMFPGATNNQMLHFQQEVRGTFPKKLVRQAAYKDKHYNDDLVFVHIETDPITNKPREHTRTYFQPVRPVRSLLEEAAKSQSGEDKLRLNHLCDFIERATVLNPKSRMTPAEALNHPFLAL